MILSGTHTTRPGIEPGDYEKSFSLKKNILNILLIFNILIFYFFFEKGGEKERGNCVSSDPRFLWILRAAKTDMIVWIG
jgi:hypothetical protein